MVSRRRFPWSPCSSRPRTPPRWLWPAPKGKYSSLCETRLTSTVRRLLRCCRLQSFPLAGAPQKVPQTTGKHVESRKGPDRSAAVHDRNHCWGQTRNQDFLIPIRVQRSELATGEPND